MGSPSITLTDGRCSRCGHNLVLAGRDVCLRCAPDELERLREAIMEKNNGAEKPEEILAEALGDETAETGIDVARDTMTGDIRDLALQWIRSLQKPWPALSEEEQRNVIESVTRGAIAAASRAVGIIAADKPGAVEATLESYTGKDGLKLVFTCLETEANLVALLRAKGTRVMISSADPARFIGERAEVKPEPDQRALPGTDGEAAEAAEA